MNKGLHLEISAERRAEVDAMSKNQLRYEIEKRKKSKLSRLLPYLEERLAEIEEEERPDEPLKTSKKESKEGEKRSVAEITGDKTARLGKWAIGISLLALLVAFVALVISAYVLFRF